MESAAWIVVGLTSGPGTLLFAILLMRFVDGAEDFWIFWREERRKERERERQERDRILATPIDWRNVRWRALVIAGPAMVCLAVGFLGWSIDLLVRYQPLLHAKVVSLFV